MAVTKTSDATGPKLRPQPSREYLAITILTWLLCTSSGNTFEGGESRLLHLVSDIDDEDATSRYREERADNNVVVDDGPGSALSSDDKGALVTWLPNDPENPYNWSKVKKAFVAFTTVTTVLNSTIGSALPSNAIPYITKEWDVTSQTQAVLPISIFLVGKFKSRSMSPYTCPTNQALGYIFGENYASSPSSLQFMILTSSRSNYLGPRNRTIWSPAKRHWNFHDVLYMDNGMCPSTQLARLSHL